MKQEKIKYESKIGLCTCVRPKTLTHTIVHSKGDPGFPYGGVEVKVYGEAGDRCKYCGKKWDNHN